MEQIVELTNELGSMPTAEYRVPARDELPPPPEAQASSQQVKLRVLALGPLQVFAGDRLVDSAAWGSARPRELLIYLMMHPDGRTKEQVGLAFWPEASAAQLRNSLRHAAGCARRWKRRMDRLTNDRYMVDPSVVGGFDVADFERELARGAEDVETAGGGSRRALEQALQRFRGDLLDGEPAGDWHLEHRDRLQRLYGDALMELAARSHARGASRESCRCYRRILARDDLHEEAVCARRSATSNSASAPRRCACISASSSAWRRNWTPSRIRRRPSYSTVSERAIRKR
jgi:DNA-binding SARP family transcriptional activator